MGSWDLACHLTHVPIGEGEPAYFFPIMPCFPNVGSSLNDAGWAFAGPPIKGVYDGYGSLDASTRPPSARSGCAPSSTTMASSSRSCCGKWPCRVAATPGR